MAQIIHFARHSAIWNIMDVYLAYHFNFYQILPVSHRKESLAMLNLNSLMVGTRQAAVLAEFYGRVLGRPADWVDAEHGFYGWQVGSSYFSVMDHSEMIGKAKDPGRLLPNFETTTVKEEFERIKAAGAAVIREPYEMGGGWIATLADPDGNYFQLVSPMDM